ncbi:hypothetical protein LTR94_031464, partial [Friedmanniomyces endolithicus]
PCPRFASADRDLVRSPSAGDAADRRHPRRRADREHRARRVGGAQQPPCLCGAVVPVRRHRGDHLRHRAAPPGAV